MHKHTPSADRTAKPSPVPTPPAHSAPTPTIAADHTRRGTSTAPASSGTRTTAARPRESGAAHPGAGPGIRRFVLDTNVLLHDPLALYVFQEHEVVIPFAVIEELDTFKRDAGDRGRSAREAIRQLDRLRTMGRLVEGVPWVQARDAEDQPRVAMGAGTGPTGTVRIDVGDHVRPLVLGADKPDNRIIAVAWAMQQRGVGNVVFVSKDLNARIKADALGIAAEDFENKKVDAERLYTGFCTAQVDGAMIDELYRDRMLALSALDGRLRTLDGAPVRALYANQFVVLRAGEDDAHTGLARRLGDTDHVIPVSPPRKPVFGILARNVQQTMALDLLLDDEVRMVTLLGSAGTGKTLLAVAAGMAKVFTEERYDKMLVARPIMPMGRDIGYLPGTKDEKLGAWMQPIFDNVAYLLSTRGAPNQAAESLTTEQRVERLIAGGQLVLEPLTYIRGRSIPHQFMIVDEAQNLTPHEIKTIISRVGEGTKVILTGDVQQIDNPYLDSASNGLAFAIERMKGLRIVGHVTLNKSERSELASLAASLL